MSEITAVGVNPRSTAFHGAALNLQRTLNLPTEVIDYFIKQHQELTSDKPMIPESVSAKYSVAPASLGDSFSPAGGKNSGQGYSLA